VAGSGAEARMAHAGQAASAVTAAAASQDRKRVKVYELKNNDWYDRGTGFCTGQHFNTPDSSPENPDARIIVISEDEPQRPLLETRITKDDGYQKQQDTLIVWTETTGVDMALSFQEAEGCAHIWEFVSEIQNSIPAVAPGDDLSDDLLDPVNALSLPDPQLGRLDDIEMNIRSASTTPAGRDALAKFVMHPDHLYILKLAPLVEMAEERESLQDLHRLCTIMKHLILLNDTSIIEFVVTDEAVMGVVGALECMNKQYRDDRPVLTCFQMILTFRLTVLTTGNGCRIHRDSRKWYRLRTPRSNARYIGPTGYSISKMSCSLEY
jgi:protein phosphatase-4 regulatory subunit 3